MVDHLKAGDTIMVRLKATTASNRETIHLRHLRHTNNLVNGIKAVHNSNNSNGTVKAGTHRPLKLLRNRMPADPQATV